MAVNWLPFLGCLFLSFGPSFTLFIMTAAQEAQAVILLITSAFFWLISLLLSSLLWLAVVPLRKHLAFTLVFSVLFQEILRVAFYILVKKTDVALSRITRETTGMFHGPRYALVSGLGYGIMSAIFMYVNVLAEASGPGTFYLQGSPSLPIILSGALQASAMTGLHVCWGLLCSDALTKRCWPLLAAVSITHLAVSCLTLLYGAGVSTLYQILTTYIALVLIAGFTFVRFKGDVKPMLKVL